MRSQYWSIARQAAGLLHKNVPSLTINITDLVIRQKQVSIGSGPQEYLISMPVAPDTLNKMIIEHWYVLFIVMQSPWLLIELFI